MGNRYADLHLHVSLKNYVNGLGDVWYHKPYRPGRDKPNRSEAHEYSQSSVFALVKGNVNLSVASLYPLENVVDDTNVSKFIAKLFFGFKARKIKKLRRNFRTKFELLNHERRLIENSPSSKLGKEFMIVRRQSDLLSDTPKLVFAIEGAHSFHGDQLNNPAFQDQVLQHLQQVKRWRNPIFMLTFCHFEYNHLAGQAWAIPIPGVAKPLIKKAIKNLTPPRNKVGISIFGWKVIKEALDNTDGYRILIDLKHASVQSRKAYYEFIKKEYGNGQVPVILSHAGVSGIETFQKQLTKVDNQKSNEARHFDKFNPWALNMCDEDIKNIVEIGGMMGISFDQRILGINNRSFRTYMKRTLRRAGKAQNILNTHTCAWLENIFHIVKVSNDDDAWRMICLSSDNDGVIDPIDSCPTAMHLQRFEQRLNSIAYPYYYNSPYRGKIFVNSAQDLNAKLRKILYDNLNEFIYDHFPR